MMTPTSSLGRTVGGVVLGYLVFVGGAALIFALSGRDSHAAQPPGFLVASIIAGILFALAGGYVAQLVARRSDMIAGVALALLIGLVALVSLVSRPGAGAIWSQLAALALMAPAAVVGARWRKGSRFEL